jgi:ATP-dependent DNA ligase I
MLLDELAAASVDVAATAARSAKVERLAQALRGLAPAERAAGALFLAGELPQRQIGVGWAALRDAPAPAAEPTLAVAEVDAAFTAIGALAGGGSQSARREAVRALLARATEREQGFLLALLGGELRHGALAAVVADAVAKAAGVPREAVRRALMLRGDLGAVAALALAEGEEGLRAVGLQVGRPLQPMLAAPAKDLDAALAKAGPAAIEVKLDGARIQVHRRDGDVAVFTRTLDDITARVPEVVEAVLALETRTLVLDGEVIALRPDGRPAPFQVTGSRLGSRTSVARLRDEVPLTPAFFDLLHVDGADLLDEPLTTRGAALTAALPETLRVERAQVVDAQAAEAFQARALDAGHEGVMVKALDAPYAAGRRGAGWLKVKPVHTLDLVVLAVEWGHGRRRGWLSNLHLGARRPDGDGFVMLGKTFKGLTDAMLAWQTERLLALETGREGHVVHVRPELVVEIAFDGVQTSPRYPGGVALRFARVLRFREDKRAEDADTLDAVLAVQAGSG